MTKLNCLNPKPAYIMHYFLHGVRRDKVRLFKAEDYIKKRKPDTLIPCRECVACRLNEKNRWASRISLECSRTKPSYFLTLTYKENPEKLIYREVQLFFKRLRKNGYVFKYFCVGEYGAKNGRPHWHIIINGINLKDLRLWKLGTNGGYYLSDSLSKIWGKGYILIAETSDATAKYIAGYTLKKYGKDLIFKVSKGFGMYTDGIKAMQTFTRENGGGLTNYEKQKLRKLYGNRYYAAADKIRAEQKLKEEKPYEIEERQKQLDSILKKIIKREDRDPL